MMKHVHPSSRRGLSLIEVLVAVALTLVVLLGVVQMFGFVSKEVSRGRAGMELAGNLRGVVQTIRNDLDGVTVTVKPWPTTGSGEGYLEYSEFVAKDKDLPALIASGRVASEAYLPSELSQSFLIGDFDDVLAFTTRSRTEPFRGVLRGTLSPSTTSPGKFNFIPGTAPTVIQSTTAEVVYFTTFDDVDGDGAWEPLDGEVRKLHRRVFLVRPDIVVNQTIASRTALVAFRQLHDLSINVTHNGTDFVAASNSLADLTRRENRFGRRFSGTTSLPFSSAFPHELETLDAITSQEEGGAATGQFLVDNALQGDRLGEDVIATNLAAFDVRVFDPLAELIVVNNRALDPGDFVYATPPPNSAANRGCFVDLAHAGRGHFVGGNNAKSRISSRPTYCTWSQHYEYDGIDQDGVASADQGTNDVDDNNQNGADDPAERETAPPYNHPIRALQATVRVFDTRTHQIRQSSVVSSFTPE